MLSEISQRKTNTYHLYVECKNCDELLNVTKQSRVADVGSKLVVTGGERQGGHRSRRQRCANC